MAGTSPCEQCPAITSPPSLAGGGWWDHAPGRHQRKAWDERDHHPPDAELYHDRHEEPLQPHEASPLVNVTYANVTSWKKHGPTLMATGADLICAAETRMASDMWDATQSRAAQQGYTVVQTFGEPQSHGAPCNGVAILARLPGTLGELPVPDHFTQRWPGRLCMGRFWPPNAKAFVIVATAYAPFYGSQGQEKEQANREFILDLFEVLAEVDGGPVLLAADLNRPAGDPFVNQFLTSGRWSDLTAEATGRREATTIDPQGVGDGKAIDYLIGNEHLMTHLRGAGQLPEPLAHHYPLTLSFAWSMDHPTLTMQECRRLPEQACLPHPQERQPDWTWGHRLHEFRQAVQEGDPDNSTREWIRRWEQLLQWRASHHGARVLPSMTQRWRLAEPQLRLRGRHRPLQECEDPHLRQLKKLRNLLIEWQRRTSRGEEITAAQTRRILALWRQCDLPPPDPLEQPDPSLDPEMPTWDSMAGLLERTRKAVGACERRLKSDRVQKWRRQLKEAHKLGSAKCHAYIKGRRLVPLQRLKDENDQIVTLPADLHRVLRQAWSPIDTPERPLTEEEGARLLDHYGHYYVPQAEWPLPPVTKTAVQDVLRHARVGASPGKGGWTIAELRSLPDLAIAELAQVYTIWDHEGAPDSLNEVYVTMIPKEERNPDPRALRPIAVSSLLVRVWTTLRVREWRDNILAGIPEEQHGGLPTRSVIQLVAELSIEVEVAKHYSYPLGGVSYDFSKFFDSLPHCMIGPILIRAGVPAHWARHYQRLVTTQRYRYRFLDRTTGPVYKKTRGVPQGDAFSVITSLLMLVALTQHVKAQAGPLTMVRMYLDDLTIRSCDSSSILRADDAVREYATQWRIQLSPKTTSFAVDHAAYQGIRRLGHPSSPSLKWLGTFHHLQGKMSQAAIAALQTKINTTRLRLRRLQWIQAPWALRQQLILGNALPGLIWCPLGQPTDLRAFRSIDQTVLTTMMATNPTALQKMAREVFWTCLVKGHRMAVTVARTFATLVALRQARPQFQRQLLQAWERMQLTGQRVRGGLLVSLQEACHHIGLHLDEQFCVTNNVEEPLPLLGPQLPKKFLHDLRQLWRRAQQRQLETRRPHFVGLLELGGIDAECLRRWIAALEAKAPHQATMARLLVTDAYRTAAWMSSHHLTAGERRYSPLCPNCQTDVPEDLHHLLWQCPCWADHRPLGYDSLTTLPLPVRRTLMPVVSLSQEHRTVLRTAFAQAVSILEQHVKGGRQCRLERRRRVIGKQSTTAHAVMGPGNNPDGSEALDLTLGGHTLQRCDVSGRPSLQCTTCNMRSTIGNRRWFALHACTHWIRRRRDRVDCPVGLRDLRCNVSGEMHCVCLWCGAADKQRSNLIRKHRCWEGALRTAIAESGRDMGDHIEYVCGRRGLRGHTLCGEHDNQTCLRCGIAGRALRFHPVCGAFDPTRFGISLDEWKEGLRSSTFLFA